MLGDIHFVEDLRDLSFLVDQKCLPNRTHVLFSVHALLAPNTVAFDYRFVGVGEQVERKLKFRDKLLVRLFIVGRDAQNLDALFLKCVVGIAERTCFLRATRSIVLWIEIEHDPLTFEIRQLHRRPILIFRFEVGSLVAFFEHKRLMNVRFIECNCNIAMKLLSEKRALEKLQRLKSDFAKRISADFEHRAKSCATCSTPGACCLDAHFVNVHITPLEAVAIRNTLDSLDAERRSKVYERVQRSIATYELDSAGDSFAKTYACPLFESGAGCLVHKRGKPLPCIAHACYENKEDLPPDDLVAEQEGHVEKLNELSYRKTTRWRPLPLAIRDASGK